MCHPVQKVVRTTSSLLPVVPSVGGQSQLSLEESEEARGYRVLDRGVHREAVARRLAPDRADGHRERARHVRHPVRVVAVLGGCSVDFFSSSQKSFDKMFMSGLHSYEQFYTVTQLHEYIGLETKL